MSYLGIDRFCRKVLGLIAMSVVGRHDVSANQLHRYSSWYLSKVAIFQSPSFFTRYISIFDTQFHCGIWRRS